MPFHTVLCHSSDDEVADWEVQDWDASRLEHVLGGQEGLDWETPPHAHDDDQTELHSGESSPSSPSSFHENNFTSGGYGSDDTTFGVDEPTEEQAIEALSNAFTQYDSDDSAATANSANSAHNYILLLD